MSMAPKCEQRLAYASGGWKSAQSMRISIGIVPLHIYDYLLLLFWHPIIVKSCHRPTVYRSFRHTVTSLKSVLLTIIFCHVSCVIAQIISPKFSYLRDGFRSLELHCYTHDCIFCVGHYFETIWWNARYSHLVSPVCDIWRHSWENTSQLIPFCLTTGIIAEIRSLKNFD